MELVVTVGEGVGVITVVVGRGGGRGQGSAPVLSNSAVASKKIKIIMIIISYLTFTAIEYVHSQFILIAEIISLPNFCYARWQWLVDNFNGRFLFILGKGCLCIVHDAFKVIANRYIWMFVGLVITFCETLYVFPYDFDVLVSIYTSMLMPQTNSMS